VKAIDVACTRLAALSMLKVKVETPPCWIVSGENALVKPIASAGVTVSVAVAAAELLVKLDVSVLDVLT